MSEILYGRQVIRECLRAGRRTVEAVFLQEGTEGPEVDAIYHRADVARRVQKMTRSSLEKRLPPGAHHQGMAAVVSPFPYDSEEVLTGKNRSLVVALDSMQDPQNVGAILRSAEAFGVDAVILPKDRSCLVTPAVVRASSGATEHLHVVVVTNLSRTLRELGEKGYWIVGAAADQGTALDTMRWQPMTALVIGSEGEGLRDGVKKACHELVTISLKGKTESLNASVAAGLLIHAAKMAICRDRANG